MLNQTAIYFPLQGINRQGQPTYGTAVQINCRWTHSVQTIVTPEGEEVSTSIQLITDTALARNGSVVLNGVLGTAVPDKNAIIRTVAMGQTISKDETLYSATL